MSNVIALGPVSPKQLRSYLSWANTKRLACCCGYQDCAHTRAYTEAKHNLLEYIKQSGDWQTSDGNHLPTMGVVDAKEHQPSTEDTGPVPGG
jgi:hypothetical protein